jgi:HlyD family secretion protein
MDDAVMIGQRRIVMWAITAVLLLLLVWGFMPKPVSVDVREVVSKTLSVTVTEEGKTRVIDRYIISAPIAGYARRVELERSGTLDPRSQAEATAAVSIAEAALSAATESVEATRAEADLARNEYERIRQVADQGLISQGALDAARAEWRSTQARLRSAEFNIEVARGELASARAALEYSAVDADGFADHVSVPVNAPVDGRVLKVIHESEGAVVQGQPLIEIGDPAALEIEVEMLSVDAVRLNEGMSVRFQRWGGEQALDGVVKRVEPSGFTKISALSALNMSSGGAWETVIALKPSSFSGKRVTPCRCRPAPCSVAEKTGRYSAFLTAGRRSRRSSWAHAAGWQHRYSVVYPPVTAW